ncbi:MAG: DsbE family thiol:disulfide interchange protein [Parvibaculales bacterium]
MAVITRFLPALFGLAVLVLFGVGLTLGPPQNIDSAYRDKPVPPFSLPPLHENADRLDDTALRQGAPVLLNIFASWCAPCRVEHPTLMALKESGITIYAINYKDQSGAAKRFLARLGNPYRAIGFDKRGDVALDLGVYGVPETFVIGPDGRVLLRHVGPLTQSDVRETILPYFKMTDKETQNAVSR